MKHILFDALVSALKWYCEKELDQFNNWYIDTKYGRVYITITRETKYPTSFGELK